MARRKSKNLAGQELGNYRVEERLSVRDGCALYLAQDLEAEESVLLAIVETTSRRVPDIAGRFQRRMETVAQLHHPYIAAIQEIGQTEDGLPYAAIAYSQRITLAERLEELARSEERLPVLEALELVGRIAEALKVAHPAGIIHQDLRPANILLDEDNSPLFIDLGLPIDSATSTSTADVLRLGELDYASPEQFEGKALSGQSNIYSLGIILYELLAGHRPNFPISSWDIFDTRRTELPRPIPLAEVRPDLAPEIHDVVKNCLWREEWNRYETVDALIDALENAIEAERARQLRASAPPNYRKWVFVALPVLLLLLLLIFLLARNSGGDPEDLSGKPTTTLIPGLATPFNPFAEGTNTTTPTASATFAPTPTARATARNASLGTIELLGPPTRSEFHEGEDLNFSWQWLTPLGSDQQFGVYVFSENESALLGTVGDTSPDNRYELEARAGDLLAPGSYFWQVVLENSSSGRALASSDFFAITITSAPAPTPTLTATLTPRPVDATTGSPVTGSATPGASGSCQVAPPSGWVEYTVRAGDALFVLATSTGTTTARVRQVNCLENNLLSVGQSLWLPFAPATNTPEPRTTPSGPGPGPPPPPPTERPTLTPPPPP